MMAAGIFGEQKVEAGCGENLCYDRLSATHIRRRAVSRGAAVVATPRCVDDSRRKAGHDGRHWAPKPDISVLRGGDILYAARHPRPRDVMLLVEVADTTYYRDRGRKWRRYAAAGIPIYIIVRLKGADTFIEVWTGPTGRSVRARYTDVIRYMHAPVNRFPSSSKGITLGQIAVTDLVAPQP